MAETTNNGRKDFLNISTPELKQIYKDSQNITTICIIWIIFTAILLSTLIYYKITAPENEQDAVKVMAVVFTPFFMLYVPAIIGGLKRASWAGTLGFVSCIPMVMAFPIGTFFGLAGVRAFQRKFLFGPDRILHSDIKSEYQYRKSNGVS